MKMVRFLFFLSCFNIRFHPVFSCNSDSLFSNVCTVLPDQVYAGPIKGTEDPATGGGQPCITTLRTVMVTPNLTGVYFEVGPAPFNSRI